MTNDFNNNKVKRYDMKRVLFVCLGNICRSPMAECVFRKMLEESGNEGCCEVDSAGILSYHQGEQPDIRMRQMALSRGYMLRHESRPVRAEDFDAFDIIIGMDDRNIDDLKERAPSVEAMEKIHRMAEYFSAGTQMDYVPDPYYGGVEGFDLALNLIEDACHNLHAMITKNDAE